MLPILSGSRMADVIEAVTRIAATHDVGLVLLAAAMCLIGGLSVVRLFARALIADGVSRLAWHLLDAVTLGAAERWPRTRRWDSPRSASTATGSSTSTTATATAQARAAQPAAEFVMAGLAPAAHGADSPRAA